MYYIKTTFITVIVLVLTLLLIITGCENSDIPNQDTETSPVEMIAPEKRNVYDLVLLGARQEVTSRVFYNASYQSIDYPSGDVPAHLGACTDVVVRAFRNAGIDLQELIHEDMRDNFNLYPQNWDLTGPDPNIDHRRVPNQMKFFERHGQSLPLSVTGEDLETWQWGDIVYMKFPNGLEHCGIISDRKNSRGIPLVIHNASIAREEDCLTRWEIIGHYRFP